MKITRDIKKKMEYDREFVSEEREENVLLGKGIYLGMNFDKTERNLNTFLVGKEESDIIYSYVKPNLLQMNTSFIVTDPEGDILRSTGKLLEHCGYKIKVLNFADILNSNHYNPFHYIRSEEDVSMMVDCFLRNPVSNHLFGEGFYDKYEKLLLEALCLFVMEVMPEEKWNFATIAELVHQMGERDSEKTYNFEKAFELYKETNPDSPAVKRYESLVEDAITFLNTIFVSCSIRLAAFNLTSVANLTSYDDFELETIGEEKTAVFCITPGYKFALSGFISLFYAQAFDTLIRYCDENEENHHLPTHVRFFYDTNSKFGVIPEFKKKITIAMPHNISFSVLVQNFSEIEKLYQEWEVVIGNCDSVILFGSQSKDAVGYFEEMILGKEIVFAPKWFDLFSLDDNHSLCIIRGCDPFYTEKSAYRNHPYFKYTGDACPEYVYNFSKKEENEN